MQRRDGRATAGQLDTDSPADRRSTLRYCRVGGSLAGQLVSYRMPPYNRDFRPGHWIIVVESVVASG